MDNNKQPRTPAHQHQSWVVCISAALFFFFEFIQMHSLSTISGEIMRDLSLNAVQLSSLSTAFFLANTVCLMPAGLLLDRVSTRTAIRNALVLCICGIVLFALTEHYWLALIGRFMAGTGNAFCFLSCMLLITRWFPPQQRAFVAGTIVTFAMLGGIVAQTPLRFAANYLGWRPTLLLDALLGLGCLAVILINVQDGPDASIKPRTVNFFTSLRLALRNWSNLLYGLYAALMNLPITLLGAMWGTLYLNQAHHIPMTQATLATSMIFFGTIVGAPLCGAWSDRLAQRHLPMLVGALVTLICVTLMLLATKLSFALASLCFFMLGLFSSTQILVYPKIAESNPSSYRATALGVASTLVMGIATLVQPCFGYLMQTNWQHQMQNSIPLYTVDNYNLALLLLPSGFFIALLIIALLPETRDLETQ
jgi:MFS family permease